VIADDDEDIRAAVRGLLGGEPQIEIVGEAGDGNAAIALVKELKPDVLVLDLAMPIATGAEVLGQMKKSAPATKVLLFTAYPDVAEPWIDKVDGRLAKTAISQLPGRLRELTA
jgi:DNA-binding NarL/FixJ family response regulator